ncbi:MAG: energy transducer TonB [Prevotellaceae bacterium]|jgi:TonB family protein|nr:energy transducer TonB [Prevotellaceae bacterium]
MNLIRINTAGHLLLPALLASCLSVIPTVVAAQDTLSTVSPQVLYEYTGIVTDAHERPVPNVLLFKSADNIGAASQSDDMERVYTGRSGVFRTTSGEYLRLTIVTLKADSSSVHTHSFKTLANVPSDDIASISGAAFKYKEGIIQIKLPVQQPPLIAEIVDTTRVEPSFPDGDEALGRFLAETMEYPLSAVRAGIQGSVGVAFTITTDGSIKNPIVIQSQHRLLDKESLRVISKMPKWIPGTVSGVPTEMTTSLTLLYGIR